MLAAQSAFGSNLSILLLVCVGIYYWRTKQKEKCIYDDIARQQAEAAAKLDALHGVGDGKVTELSMAMRRTSFKLSESDTGVITYVCSVFLVCRAISLLIECVKWLRITGTAFVSTRASWAGQGRTGRSSYGGMPRPGQ